MHKIVHLTSVHPAYDARIFHKECKSLLEMGYEVVLVAPHEQNEIVNGVRIHAIPKPTNRFQRIVQTTWQVLRAAQKEKAMLYHFHDPELIPIGMLLKRQGAQVIYDIHEDYVTSIAQKNYFPLLLRKLIARKWDRVEVALGKRFNIILAEKYYQERFPSGVTVLNYPRKENFQLSPSYRSSSLRKLLYTGVITEDRGALIHAQLVKLSDNIEVHMVGRCSTTLKNKMLEVAGSARNRLYLETSETIVPYQKILSYYQRGGWLAGLALFLPTPHYIRKENTKLFEYMGAGIPILCSDFPNWSNLINKTECGICLNIQDMDKVNQVIQFLGENSSKSIKMGLNGKKAMYDLYNWENESLKLLKLYQELIG